MGGQHSFGPCWGASNPGGDMEDQYGGRASVSLSAGLRVCTGRLAGKGQGARLCRLGLVRSPALETDGEHGSGIGNLHQDSLGVHRLDAEVGSRREALPETGPELAVGYAERGGRRWAPNGEVRLRAGLLAGVPESHHGIRTGGGLLDPGAGYLDGEAGIAGGSGGETPHEVPPSPRGTYVGEASLQPTEETEESSQQKSGADSLGQVSRIPPLPTVMVLDG